MSDIEISDSESVGSVTAVPEISVADFFDNFVQDISIWRTFESSVDVLRVLAENEEHKWLKQKQWMGTKKEKEIPSGPLTVMIDYMISKETTNYSFPDLLEWLKETAYFTISYPYEQAKDSYLAARQKRLKLMKSLDKSLGGLKKSSKRKSVSDTKEDSLLQDTIIKKASNIFTSSMIAGSQAASVDVASCMDFLLNADNSDQDTSRRLQKPTGAVLQSISYFNAEETVSYMLPTSQRDGIFVNLTTHDWEKAKNLSSEVFWKSRMMQAKFSVAKENPEIVSALALLIRYAKKQIQEDPECQKTSKPVRSWNSYSTT